MLNLTADPEKVKHLLITARDELRERGWMQGDYGTTDGPKCTLGALNWAATGAPGMTGYRPALSDSTHALALVLGNGYIHQWNDWHARTADEVVATFEAGIALVDDEIARRAALVEQLRQHAVAAGVDCEAAR